MPFSLRLTPGEEELYKQMADLHEISVGELIRKTMIERFEDEYDLKLYKSLMEKHKENPVTASHEEMKKTLGVE